MSSFDFFAERMSSQTLGVQACARGPELWFQDFVRNVPICSWPGVGIVID